MSKNYLSKGSHTWYFSDFETVTENTNFYDQNKDTRVILGCTMNYETEEYELSTSIEEWWEQIINKPFSQTIIFHNVKFDAHFMLPFFSKKYKLYSVLDELMGRQKPDNGFSAFFNGTKVYVIHVWFRKWYRKQDGTRVKKDINIYIRCSYLLLNSSINALGKSLGIDKHEDGDKGTERFLGRDREFYDWEPVKTVSEFGLFPRGARFVEYCINDVRIALRSIKNFRDCILELDVIKEENARREQLNKTREIEIKLKGKSQIWEQKPFEPLSGSLTSASVTTKICRLYTQRWINQQGLNIGKTKKEQVNVDSFWKIDKDTYDYVSYYYMGGFTQINKDYVGKKADIGHGVMIDITSAYPYQMTKHPMPYGELLDEEPEGMHYEFIEAEIKSAKIKPQYTTCPMLRNWKSFLGERDAPSGRYVRELKNFKCYYIRQEWEIIKKMYDLDIKSYSSKFMKADYWLRDSSFNLFNIKEHYASLGQDGLKQAAKILVNASYGIHAKSDQFDSYTLLQNEMLNELGLEENEYGRIDRKSIGTIIETIDNTKKEPTPKHFEYRFDPQGWDINENLKYIKLKPLDPKAKCPNKAAAAVITAMERVYLFETLDRVGFDKFLVSDTDSIAFGNLSMKDYWNIIKITKEIKIEGSPLGMWDLEFVKKGTVFKYFGTYGAKKYGIWDYKSNQYKFRCAGLSVDEDYHYISKPGEFYDVDATEVFDFEKEENVISNATKVFNYHPNGVTLKSVDKTISKTYN